MNPASPGIPSCSPVLRPQDDSKAVSFEEVKSSPFRKGRVREEF
jgi:hypothetical protein